MTIYRLLSAGGRRWRRSFLPFSPSSCSFSTSSSPASVPPTPTSDAVPSEAPAPPFLHYDSLAEAVRVKIKRLDRPDPRFLRYASPHPSVADHTPILDSPATRVTTLPNGIRVATESTLAARTATVGVWIDAGSRFESDATSGTAHFLERMISKGAGDRATEIDNFGWQLSAYTTREQTAFYAKVLDKDVSKALEILAETLQNSTLDEATISQERDVILGEEMIGKSEEVIFDHLHATAFQYSPLGRSITGHAENTKSLTQEHLVNYMSNHYTAPRMVISAAGAVRHEEIVEQGKKLFQKLSADPTTALNLVAKEPAFFTGSEVRCIDDDIPLAQFAVAFSGVSWIDSDSTALKVMQNMLGSWNKNVSGGKHMGSELVQRVAINEIAESMTAFNINYKDTGLFGVQAVAEPDCLADLAWAIMHEISKLSYRVSETDVIRARNQLKSSILLKISGSTAVAEDIGHQVSTYGRRIPLAELFARIDAVDASTVKRVANRFLFDQDVAIAAMGPIQSLPDYNWFRRRTYLLRY